MLFVHVCTLLVCPFFAGSGTIYKLLSPALSWTLPFPIALSTSRKIHISYKLSNRNSRWMDTAWKCRTWSNALILNAIAQQKHSFSFASFHSQKLAGWKQENVRTCFINEKPCRVRLPSKALSSELRIIDSPLAALIQCWAYSIAKNAVPISSHLYPTDSHSSQQRITSHQHWEEGFWKATACFSATSAISCSVILV